MTEEDWCHEILKITARLKDRQSAGKQIVLHPQLLEYSLYFINNSSNPELITNSAYAVDQALRTNIGMLRPYKSLFFEAFGKLRGHTEKRIFAKIFELISEAHLKNNFPLKPEESKLLVAQAFDWLISDEKVAVKAFAMQCIFNLRNTESWIKMELLAQLELQFPDASPAFQARAKHLLKKLKK